MSDGLHWIDVLIIAAYAVGMLAVGWHFSRRQSSTDEYFTAGRGQHPLLIGISLFATLLSTVSYLSGPGEIIRNGPYMLMGLLGTPISFLIVGYVIIPIYMRQQVTSAYELLEARLGLTARLMGATMFILLRAMWMAVLLNFSASAFLVMTGLDASWLFPMTAAIGGVALFYSTLGGLRAVVWTDAFQFLLLFGGAITVVLSVTLQLEGASWFPTSWDSTWERQPLFSLDPHIRLSVCGVILMQILWSVCTYGGDQTAVQRFMATVDAKAARRSFLTTTVAAIAVTSLLALVGLSLLGYFRAFPQALPSGQTLAESADRLFPHYIATQLPVGLSGLVVSGLFAAAMSSVDSGVNSISSVVSTDFLNRLGKGRPSNVSSRNRKPIASTKDVERRNVRVAKWTALATGIVVIAGSGLITYVPGNLLGASKRVLDMLVAPLFLLFFFAIFVRFSTPIGAVTGSLSAFVAAISVAFWKPLFGNQAVTFTWISPIALVVGMTIGVTVSLLTPGAIRAHTSHDPPEKG